jgi:hypothetical protein
MTQAYNLALLANFVNTSGQLDASTGLYNTSAIGFPAGTLMLFQQTAAPTGWTKQTTHNDKALRVVSGTASSGGSVGFTTAFGTPSVSGSVSATTLSTAQIPSHSHSAATTGQNSNGGGDFGDYNSNPGSTGSTGGGGSHTHSLSSATTTINVSYVDLIIASKN